MGNSLSAVLFAALLPHCGPADTRPPTTGTNVAPRSSATARFGGTLSTSAKCGNSTGTVSFALEHDVAGAAMDAPTVTVSYHVVVDGNPKPTRTFVATPDDTPRLPVGLTKVFYSFKYASEAIGRELCLHCAGAATAGAIEVAYPTGNVRLAITGQKHVECPNP